MTRLPVPPFGEESARQKAKAAEDGWNTRDPEKVAQAYTEDSEWRNRDEFFKGREQIVAFLRRKWERELDYRLMKELWCYAGNRISVRFEYESHDQDGQWWRNHHHPGLQRGFVSSPSRVGGRRSSWRWSS
jgi:nuclear transport factor 2 (NTF2) superfamily protein